MSQSTTPAWRICFLHLNLAVLGCLRVGSILMELRPLFCYRTIWTEFIFPAKLSGIQGKKKTRKGALIKTISTLRACHWHMKAFELQSSDRSSVFPTPGGILQLNSPQWPQLRPSFTLLTGLLVCAEGKQKSRTNKWHFLGMEECAHTWQLMEAH